MLARDSTELQALAAAIAAYQAHGTEANFEEIEALCAHLLIESESLLGWFVWRRVNANDPDRHLRALANVDVFPVGTLGE